MPLSAVTQVTHLTAAMHRSLGELMNAQEVSGRSATRQAPRSMQEQGSELLAPAHYCHDETQLT
jgi:hypothetical protein